MSRVAPSRPAGDAPPFWWNVRVYWEDTDAGGIVFYANYLKFMERARTEWLRSLGLVQSQLRADTGGQFVVSDAQLRFLRPARLDDRLSVSAEALDLGRVSITIRQQVLRHGAADAPPDLLCDGTVRVGWVDATSQRPARLPPLIHEVLNR